MPREERSFCRLCLASCGVRLTIGDDGRLVSVRGDKEHPSSGYACMKGLAAPELHNGPDRLLKPLKREGDRFVEIGLDQALDEIAAALTRIAERDGPDAVALYNGTQAAFNAALGPMTRAFMTALKSKSTFSTMTVDQSAKWVTAERLGVWGAGTQTWDESDVWMFFGTNPLVSVVGGVNGFISLNPDRRIKEAKARGLKLIVVDPRLTETARHADLFLQVRPGSDAALAAGMLRLILTQGWADAEFCARHVADLDALRRAVDPFTPEVAAEKAGIAPAELVAAATLFARQGRRGCAFTGTGPSMSPHSNLAEHLVQALNVVCGRFVREGEPIANPGAAGPRRPFRAEVIGPFRSYERSPKSRVGDFGLLFGEMPACTLADEILQPGPGQLKAVLVSGANPVATLPDLTKVVRAFKGLELAVAIEPYMTSTAKLCHYILPPKLVYERADLPMLGLERALYPAPFSQYAPAHLSPPAGAEVVDDWCVFWALARRMGLSLVYDGVALDMQHPPATDDLLAILLRNAIIPFEEIRRHPGGAVFPVEPQVAEPPSDNAGRFETAPADVVAELAEVLAESDEAGPYTHRLVVRRMRETVNTLGPHLAAIRRRKRFNPLQLNPADLGPLRLSAGDKVAVISAHGRIPAIVEADETLRPGVCSLSHGWGTLPDDDRPYEEAGSSPTLLIDAAHPRETINAMARLSAIPVRIERLA
jgi:anaerobic selenocysteine-containing dehydrogenase